MMVEAEGLIDMSQPGKEEDSEDSAEIEMTEVTKTFLLKPTLYHSVHT